MTKELKKSVKLNWNFQEVRAEGHMCSIVFLTHRFKNIT